jgi:hypothetical protein
VRLRWTGKDTAEPDTQSVEDSIQTVSAILEKYRHGWRHLEQFVAANVAKGDDAIVLDTSDTEAIADDLHHLVGSVTGRVLVNQRFGKAFTYYNCHAPSTGPLDPKTGKPVKSKVLQLRNQHPELEHC